MTEAVIVAIIGGLFTFLGVFFQNRQHNKSITELISYRMDIIEKKQDKYNNILERMIAMETTIDHMQRTETMIEREVEKLRD